MAPARDYTRVCQRCGTQWLLPKEYATDKAPRALQVRAMQRATRHAIGRQRVKYSTQTAALQANQDRVLQNAMCPKCGSSDYRQYKPGEAPATPLPPPPPPPTAPTIAALWAADPNGRHELRYWDGFRWTEHLFVI